MGVLALTIPLAFPVLLITVIFLIRAFPLTFPESPERHTGLSTGQTASFDY